MAGIIGVHGVGNYRGRHAPADVAAALSTRWTQSLARGLARDPAGLDLRVVYYAHHLHRDVAQAGAGLEALDDDAQQMILDWVDALGAPADVAQGWLTQPVRKAIEWAAAHLGTTYEVLAEAFVAVFFGEVSTYLGRDEVRERARDTVADAIAEARPSVVIAHSLGSVVTYEALWAHPEIELPLLVTVGSPLGLPKVVYERLRPQPAVPLGARPPGVGRWVNIADHGDFIAIPKRLADVFDVDEDHRVSIHVADFHRVVNYLAAPKVAAAVQAYL